jgi:hypothetical protein
MGVMIGSVQRWWLLLKEGDKGGQVLFKRWAVDDWLKRGTLLLV